MHAAYGELGSVIIMIYVSHICPFRILLETHKSAY